MDAKITKLRLSRFLSYDWLKIVGLSVAFIIVWTLIFTMTATRVLPSQQFTVINYTSNNTLGDGFYKSLNKAKENGVFSYEVIENTTVDLRASGDSANTILEARFTTDEGDAIFVSGAGNPKYPVIDELTEEEVYDVTTDSEGNERKTLRCQATYLETFISGWYYNLELLKEGDEERLTFFEELKAYLARFYTDWSDETEELSEDAKALIEKDFRKRAKGDKRYKTEKQIKKAVQNEILRVEQSRTSLLKFYDFLGKGYVELTDFTYEDVETGETVNLGSYAINLCPDERMDSLKNIVSYTQTWYDADDKAHYETTARDMHIILLDLGGIDECFKFEALNYVVYLVESCCTELNPQN